MGHCGWAYVNEREHKYHDTEWGVPVHDDRQMFEHLTLENLQCGLSWDLMLKRGRYSGNALITLNMIKSLLTPRRTCGTS